MKRACLSLLFATTIAHAGDRGAAEKYFRAGEQAFQAQNFEAAAKDFEAAYVELPIPEIAFSAAQAYRRQYRIDPKPIYVQRGLALFQAYVKAVKTGGRVADAADAINDLERELDRLIRAGAKVSPEVAAEHTQLGISVLLDRASTGVHEVDDPVRRAHAKIAVMLDGKAVEPFAPINVVPGPHAIHVEVAGYKPVDRNESIIQGTSSMIEIPLEPLPAQVTVSTEPAAHISIDGRSAGVAPVAPIALAAGHHLVTITRRGRIAVEREVSLANGQRLDLHAPLVPTAQRRAVRWVGLSAATLAAIAVGTGGLALYYDREAVGLRGHLQTGNASAADLADYATDRTRRDDLRGPALLFATGAVVAGLVTAGLYYFDTPIAEGVTITPVVGGGVISARF
jgi:hypothetical protein